MGLGGLKLGQKNAKIGYLEKIQEVPLVGFKEPLPNPDPIDRFFLDNVDSEFGDPLAGEGSLHSEEVAISYMCVGCSKCHCSSVYAAQRSPKCLKIYDELEKAGTNISYRCPDCRDCKDCRDG